VVRDLPGAFVAVFAVVVFAVVGFAVFAAALTGVALAGVALAGVALAGALAVVAALAGVAVLAGVTFLVDAVLAGADVARVPDAFAGAVLVTALRAVDRAAGAAADRAADVVRAALLVAGVCLAAMAYRPLRG
jgi:hypothetical protein